MKASLQKATLTGSIMVAIAGSTCCLGPVVLALLGLGGASALASLTAYRLLFMGMTAVLLGIAYYLTYRKKSAGECKQGEVCEYPGTSRLNKILLWLVTLFVLLFILSPEILAIFV